MADPIMVGCDMHDRSLLLRYAIGRGEPRQKAFVNDSAGRSKMIGFLLQEAQKCGAERIIFVYEASGLGFGLCDQLHDQGIECHVLSPTLLPKTAKSCKQKTDPKDAQMLLEQLRGHVLAGNSLPAVWTPPQRLRDDRELVRCRIDLADKVTRVKLQILTMLKRRGLARPEWFSGYWSKRWIAWLRETAAKLDPVVTPVLASLVDNYQHYHGQLLELNRHLQKLSKTARYAEAHRNLRKLPGVGLLTAMAFLTEMGDLNRFHNRREVASYLGLCPASFESGETGDRKGHITRQGPSRLRRMLCQAAWSSLGRDPEATSAFKRIQGAKKNQRKKALVALMRKLGVKMWHRAMAAGVSSELTGRGGPHASATVALSGSGSRNGLLGACG